MTNPITTQASKKLSSLSAIANPLFHYFISSLIVTLICTLLFFPFNVSSQTPAVKKVDLKDPEAISTIDLIGSLKKMNLPNTYYSSNIPIGGTLSHDCLDRQGAMKKLVVVRNELWDQKFYNDGIVSPNGANHSRSIKVSLFKDPTGSLDLAYAIDNIFSKDSEGYPAYFENLVSKANESEIPIIKSSVSSAGKLPIGFTRTTHFLTPDYESVDFNKSSQSISRSYFFYEVQENVQVVERDGKKAKLHNPRLTSKMWEHSTSKEIVVTHGPYVLIVQVHCFTNESQKRIYGGKENKDVVGFKDPEPFDENLWGWVVEQLEPFMDKDRHRIVLASPASSSINPAYPEEKVQFNVDATCSKGHELSYQWTALESTVGFDNPSSKNPFWKVQRNNTEDVVYWPMKVTVSCKEGLYEEGKFVQQIKPEQKVIVNTKGYTYGGEMVKIVEGTLYDPSRRKTFKAGDRIPFEEILEADDLYGVKITTEFGNEFYCYPSSRIRLFKGSKKRSSKSGVKLVLGRLWANFAGYKSTYAIETYNSVAGVEDDWEGAQQIYKPMQEYYAKSYEQAMQKMKIKERRASNASEILSFEIEYDEGLQKTTLSVKEGTATFACKNNGMLPVLVGAGNIASFDNNCTPVLNGVTLISNMVGATHGFMPTADSHIYAYSYSSWNRADWGSYSMLGAGYHPVGGEKRAFLKFDVGDVLPNAIGKATLRLYHYHTGGNPDLNLGIYEVNEDWEEGDGVYKPHSNATGDEICWVNQPGFIDEPVVTFSPGHSTNKWVEADVTNLVQDWAAGMPNHGLMIKAVGSLVGQGESNYGFYAREHKEADKRPQLLITPMRLEGNVITNQDQKPDIYVNEPTANDSWAQAEFYEDFAGNASNYFVDNTAHEISNNKLYWHTGNFLDLEFNWKVPMENFELEFDGYTESNGINVFLYNQEQLGYTMILGGWHNRQSGSDYGNRGANRELVNGQVWNLKQWHHYKIVRSGNSLSAYCDDRLIFERTITKHFDGLGTLQFNSWNSRLGIDNVRFHSIGGSGPAFSGIGDKNEITITNAFTSNDEPTLEKLWEHDLREADSEDLYIGNSLAIGLDGNIYYGAAGGSGVLAKPLRVHAIDKSSGRLLWKTEKLETTGLQSQILIGDDGTVHVASGHKLYAFDHKTGAIKWVWEVPARFPDPYDSKKEINARGGIGYMALTDEGYILASTGAGGGHYHRGIYIIDTQGRMKLFFHKEVGTGVATGLYVGKRNTVYYYARLINPEDAGLKLIALDLNVGKVKWMVDISGVGAGENNIAIMDDGNLFCSFAYPNPQDMRYHLINGEDGSFIWSGTERAESFYKLVGGNGTSYRGRNAVKIDRLTGGIVKVTKGYPYDYATLGAINDKGNLVVSFAKNRASTLGLFDPNDSDEPISELTLPGLEGETMAISDDGIIYGIINTSHASRLPTKIVAVRSDAPLAKKGWPRRFHDNQNTSNVDYNIEELNKDISYTETIDYNSSSDIVAGTLNGLRWEMPCNNQEKVCNARIQKQLDSATLGGDPDQLYELTLRFRGVVEYHSYTGGEKDGLWYTGGRSNQGSYNIYRLETTDPPQSYFLNADQAGISRCWPIDYSRKIKVRGGSRVILSADAQDGALISNHDGSGNPIIIPGIDPAPNSYHGQFIQMDVISVRPTKLNK